jgi:hypothetical protein
MKPSRRKSRGDTLQVERCTEGQSKASLALNGAVKDIQELLMIKTLVKANEDRLLLCAQ